MDRVLFIPELLELILLHLDLDTLLVSAFRVNKTWNAMINMSIPLQQALYFQPVPTPQQSGAAYQPIVNPLLKKRFGTCFFDTDKLRRFIRCANSFYTMPCAGTLWDDGWEPTPLHLKDPQVADMKPEKIHHVEAACRKLTRKEASWRKMFISQPPPPSLGFLWMEDRGTSPSVRKQPCSIGATLVDHKRGLHPLGVRMGLLYDVVQHHTSLDTRGARWFRVVWNQDREPDGPRAMEKCYQRVLNHTSVVVEGYPIFDPRIVEHRKHEDALVFAQRFRSKAYGDTDLNTNQIDCMRESRLGLDHYCRR
ncbi:hypothetical protein F4825DRAFT_173165 [Nemania diffusa]|nr:hypothetical protein F4825DRAFT_173165 [Nemania diffusa]